MRAVLIEISGVSEAFPLRLSGTWIVGMSGRSRMTSAAAGGVAAALLLRDAAGTVCDRLALDFTGFQGGSSATLKVNGGSRAFITTTSSR